MITFDDDGTPAPSCGNCGSSEYELVLRQSNRKISIVRCLQCHTAYTVVDVPDPEPHHNYD